MKIFRFLTQIFFPKILWLLPTEEKKIYLTFDDGPTEEVTEWVLEQLQEYNAKATFFCLGENIETFPRVFKKIIENGHTIGNHTFSHTNGWKVNKKDYLADIDAFNDLVLKEYASSSDLACSLFRPPYGKLNPFAYSNISKYSKIIMWDVLTKDYKKHLNCEKQLNKIIKQTRPGSIIVFHDSKKAFEKLQFMLPAYLKHFDALGYVFERL